jgi:hypothetical protein
MTPFQPYLPVKPEPKFAATVSVVTSASKSVLNATQSWRAVSRSVFLFNRSNDLAGEVANVDFITPQNNPASLKEMLAKLAWATRGDGIGVLAHEDVFIQPDTVKVMEVSKKNSLGNAWAATSRCKEYHPGTYGKTETFTQTGLGTGYNTFITTHPAWKAMEKACPGSIVGGTPEAHQWVAKFLTEHIQHNRYHDIEGISPFWQPQRKKDPANPEAPLKMKGPVKRYV